MLYGFEEDDVRRLRRMLQAYEHGQLRQGGIPEQPAAGDGRDTYLVAAIADISAGASGLVQLCAIDGIPTPPDAATVEVSDRTQLQYTLFNNTAATIAADQQLAAVREPTSGVLLPVASGAPPGWIEVTSTSLSAVTLSGGSIMAYPAEQMIPDPATGTFGTGPSVWFISPNTGEDDDVPETGRIYAATQIAVDTSGVAVFAGYIAQGIDASISQTIVTDVTCSSGTLTVTSKTLAMTFVDGLLTAESIT